MWKNRNRLYFAAAFIFVAVLIYQAYERNKAPKIPALNLPQPKQDLVIQLGVYCDQDFSALFDHDYERIVKYWEAFLYSVHLRFKTLPSFSVSFEVPTLQVLTVKDQLSMLPTGKASTYLLSNSSSFQSWVYQQTQKNILAFDIAVLALGSQIEDKTVAWASTNSVCQEKSETLKEWKSSITFTIQHPYAVADFARKVALVLGAVLDDSEASSVFCPNQRNADDMYIMASDFMGYFPPYFFSSCTNQILRTRVDWLLFNNMFCLNPTPSTNIPMIDTAKLFVSPEKLQVPSFDEQCHVFYTNSSWVDFPAIDACSGIICQQNGKIKQLQPLDGTMCNNNLGPGRCSRSGCVPDGIQLVNVGTGKCLVAEDGIFSSNDKAVMRDCSDFSLSALMDVGDFVRIWQPSVFYLPAEQTAKRKALNLRLNPENGEPVAVFDSAESQENSFAVTWENQYKSKTEFVLKHRLSQMCAYVSDDFEEVQFSNNCLGYDNATLWKLVGKGLTYEVCQICEVIKTNKNVILFALIVFSLCMSAYFMKWATYRWYCVQSGVKLSSKNYKKTKVRQAKLRNLKTRELTCKAKSR